MQAVRIVILAAAIAAAPAIAGDWITVSGLSYHSKRDHGPFAKNSGDCEVNPGLGIEHDIAADARLIAGWYRNSHCRRSEYIGAQFLPLQFAAARVGLSAALLSGYSSGFMPAILPTVAFEGPRFGINLVGAPVDGGFVVGLAAKTKWEPLK